MKCDFHVGQKVVCISDQGDDPNFTLLTDIERPKVGRIYTVRRISVGSLCGKVGITVEEIPEQRPLLIRDGMMGIGSVLFDAIDFRPLVARKTDISIFTDMLNRVGEPVDA